jgi:hypothetical protein
MSVAIGCTVDATAVLDAQCGFKVGVRDYFWEGHNPSYLAGYALGRGGIMSWKFRGPDVFPANDFAFGAHDAAFNAYLDDLLALGMIFPVSMVEHEADAAAAAASGTEPQLDAALVHGDMVMRKHPLWKPSGAKVGVCLTGYRIADLNRGPAFPLSMAKADVLVFDPYATATATVDDEAGAIMDWCAKNYPGKEVQFGEWGIPVGKPNRSGELAATVAKFNTARYAALSAAYYWNGGGFLIMGSADQPALVTAIKAGGRGWVPTTDWQANYNALVTSFLLVQQKNARLTTAMVAAQAALSGGLS